MDRVLHAGTQDADAWVLRRAELSGVVAHTICLYTINVGEKGGLYKTAQIFQKFKRRLKILRVGAAVKD